MKQCLPLLIATFFFCQPISVKSQSAASPAELSGNIIYYDQCSETEFPVSNAFDNDLNTYFRSCSQFGNWIGIDLGTKHVITSVAYSPRMDAYYGDRLRLAVIEGANNPDFGDAIAIGIVRDSLPEALTEQSVSCSRGFRYVRLVFPTPQIYGKSSYVSELKFYGYASDGDDSQLPQLTNLPTISIHTVNAQDIVSKEEYIRGIISVVYDHGTKVYTDSLNIRGRGNYSWTLPKKPYRLKLDASTHFMDLPAKAKNWTLINNYGDKTLMRNMLAFDFSRRLGMAYTSPAEAVDVVLNGDYKGCYQLSDQIDVRNHRVDIEEMDETGLTGGYLVEIDAYAYQEPKQFTSPDYTVPVTIKYPDDDVITTEQENYIADQFNLMTASIAGESYMNPSSGYRKYLDTRSFLQHFLVGEYSGNTDTYWSVNMYKFKDDEKFYVGPVWDLELGFENDRRTYSIADKANQYNEWIALWNETSAAGGTKDMVRRLLGDNTLISELKSMYSDLRDRSTISENVLENVVDSCATLLQESQNLNFKRWPILGMQVHENPVIYGSYNAEVDNVRDYIRDRLIWLDKKIGYVPTTQLVDAATDMPARIRTELGVLIVEDLPVQASLRIVDMYGVVRYNGIPESTLSINLNQGVYIITIQTGDKVYTKKSLVR